MMEPYYETENSQLYCGDSLEVLREIDSNSIQCCITSPPYWNQRDYQVKGQLGLETTPQEFISNLCDIFDEAKRVLKDNGTCFVVIGDSYAGACGMGSQMDNKAKNGMQIIKNYSRNKVEGIKNKSLCQIPSRFAIEMTARGWILRNEIIWHKPNGMPQSCKDRFTVDFEKVFFFSKNGKYKFNRQLEPYDKPLDRWGGDDLEADGQSLWDEGTGQITYRNRNMRPNPEGRNKRCVWNVPTKPNNLAHFATYPPALIIPCILAGTDESDTIIDPFSGSNTTGLTALKYNRKFLSIELSKEYCEIAVRRIKQETSQLKLFR